MKRKTILLVLFALISSLTLSVNAQGKTITIWVTGGDNDANAVKGAAAPFEEATGITVDAQAVDWGNAYSQYLTAVNSGSGADIYAGGMSWGISLGGVGGLVDLKAQFPEEYQEVLDMNNPAFVQGTIGIDGAGYVVPFNQDVFLMYYLPDNLTQAGVDKVPETWDEFTAALQALKDAGLGGAGIGWGNASWLSFQPYLAQAGGSWYTEDCSAAAINSDAGLQALEYYTSLYADYGVPQAASDSSGLSTGSLSILFDGEWVALGIDPSYPDLAGKWAVAPLPVGPAGNNDTFIGGKAAGIFSYSPNVDEAWQFLKWFQTAEAQQGLTEQYANLNAMHVPVQPENYQFITGGEALNTAVSKQLEATSGPANCPGWEESNADVNLALQSVLFEEGDFQDALIQMEDTLNANLEEYGSGS